MRDHITHLWGHIFALLFSAALLLVGINFFLLRPALSAFILSIFAIIYLAAAFITRRTLTVYPGILLLVAACNLVLYALGVPPIYLPLANTPLVLALYLLARRLKDLGFVSSGLNGSALVLVLGLVLFILLQIGTFASSAPILAFLTFIFLSLFFTLRFAVERNTWHLWACVVLVVPGYLFLLHSFAALALYFAATAIMLVAIWNLTRKRMVGEPILLMASALYVASAAFLQSFETTVPLGYIAGALALTSLSLSQHDRLQDEIPSLAAGLVLTFVPVALTFPWSQYTVLFAFLALAFCLYTFSGGVLLGRERSMMGLMIGHSHVVFAEVIALVALAYAAFNGFPPRYVNALSALLMAAAATLAGLRVKPIVAKFRCHFFYIAGLFLTFAFLTALWRADPWHNAATNLSLTVLVVLLLYALAEPSRPRVDSATYETLLEVPAITVAVSGALYVLNKSLGFSIDLLLPVALVLPGALAYWVRKRPQALASTIVGFAVLVLAALMAAGVSNTVAALVFLALGVGLAVWQVQSWKLEVGSWRLALSGVERLEVGSYVRLFSLGVVTLTSVGLVYPWRVPEVFIAAAWPVVYLVAASFLQTKERRVTRIGLEASGYGLMLLTAAVLAAQALVLPAAIIAALYALTFFVVAARTRQTAYLYPACGFTVLAAFLAALVVGLATWCVLLAFPLTVIFYAAGVRWQVAKPLYFGGHLNAVVGAIAFLLLALRLDDAVALAGTALHLIVYAWMAFRRQERNFLAGVALALSLLLLIALSFFVERANVLGYFIPIALLLLGYGWLLRRRGDAAGSLAILSTVSAVALVSGGVVLWAEKLNPASAWTVLVVGSLVWLGLLLLTRLDVFIYLITASLALLGYSFLRTVSDRFVNHIFIFLVYGCLLIALVFVYDLISSRMRFRAPIHFGRRILRRDWLIFGLPVVVLAGVALAGFGVESTASPPFCNACHTMSPYYTSWQNSAHGRAGVSCVDCHYAPGVQSYVRNKIVGLSEVVKTATATEGYKPMTVVSDQSCLRGGCHTTTALKNAPVLMASRISFSHSDHLERTLRGVEVRCTVCHTMTRADQHFSINEQACLLCHFKGRQDAATAVGQCLLCHASIRAQPTKGGFSHAGVLAGQKTVDCTTCHKGVTVGDGGIKEECSACHLQDRQDLLKGEPSKIHRIHVTGEGVGCDRCHERVQHGAKPLVAAVPTPAPTAAPTLAVASTPPNTPANHAGRTQCLVCHATGVGGTPKIPTVSPDHTTFKDDNNASLCLSCHPVAK
jgi:nitrate/TMAO reductase-like tetraheme cytochrome c subunit